MTCVGAPDVADVWGFVETVGGEVDAVEVGGFGELFHACVGAKLGSVRGKTRVKLLAGVEDGVPVEIARSGSGSRRGIGHGVGGCFGDEDVGEGDVKGLGGDNRHFGVEALAHLAAAMSDKNGAVMVDVDKGAGLIEEYCRKGDAEFCRNDGESAFVPFVFRIEVFDRFSALGVVGFGEDLLVHEWNVPIFQLLIEMGDFMWFIHVDLTKLFNRHPQMVGDF